MPARTRRPVTERVAADRPTCTRLGSVGVEARLAEMEVDLDWGEFQRCGSWPVNRCTCPFYTNRLHTVPILQEANAGCTGNGCRP